MSIKVRFLDSIPIQIEFSKDMKRSDGSDGSLHLRSNLVKKFTDDEWNYIQKEYKHLNFELLNEEKKLKKKVKPKVDETLIVEPDTGDKPFFSREPFDSKQKKKQKKKKKFNL